MSGSIGVEFSQHVGLLPMFMQPMFVLLILGGSGDVPIQMRMLTYGFVASSLAQTSEGRPDSKSSQFCARLASPDLLKADVGDAGKCWEWDYSVYRVKAATIKEAVERDGARLREAISCGRWS